MMTKSLFKVSLLAIVFRIAACKEESAVIGQEPAYSLFGRKPVGIALWS